MNVKTLITKLKISNCYIGTGEENALYRFGKKHFGF